MIVNQKGKGCDNFQTPKYIFDQLNAKFNFTVDAACTTKDKLCKRGFCVDAGVDALEESWEGERVFCNPPFSEKAKWIEKAAYEVTCNNCPLVVMILPTNSMDSKPWAKYIYGSFLYDILLGRISFINPETGLPQDGNNSGTTIVYFWKKVMI